MGILSIWIQRIFIGSVLVLGLLITRSTRAESALQAMGEAMEKQYYDVYKLGPGSTPEQRRKLQEQNFKHANQKWKQEMRELMIGYQKSGSKQLEDRFKKGKLAGIAGKKGKGKKEGVNIDETSRAPAVTPSGTARGKDSRTGDQGGSGGASTVTFGTKH